MKPWCHNRPDRAEVGRWVDTGRGDAHVARDGSVTVKNRYRWRRAFRDINACKAYDVPEGTVPAPVLMGWICEGCKHLPRHANANQA